MLNLKSLILASFASIALVACADKSNSQSDAVSEEDGPEIISGLFYDDDGQNCVLYVTDPTSGEVDEKAAKRLILKYVTAENFEVCDERPRPKSVGLYAVSGLDEYDQPDWSNSTEHYFFKIKGWSKLKKTCTDTDFSEDCLAALDTILISE